MVDNRRHGIERRGCPRAFTSHWSAASFLFTRNYSNTTAGRSAHGAIRALRTPHLLIAVDHEGAACAFSRGDFTRLPAARLLGRRFDEDRADALALAQSVGWLMAANCAG